jgi:hypothetical protein
MDKQASTKGWRVRVNRDEKAGPPVPWRPGYVLPRHWTATIEAESLPYAVELDMVADDGGPRCRAIRLEAEPGGEISSREIRRVPLSRCLPLAIGFAALREGPSYAYTPDTAIVGNWTHQGHALPDPAGYVEASKLARPSDVRTKDARLREVAEAYKAAQERTGKPTQAVERELHCSYSTAARLVMEARRRGFLPPSRRSQPRKETKR